MWVLILFKDAKTKGSVISGLKEIIPSGSLSACLKKFFSAFSNLYHFNSDFIRASSS